MLTWPHLPPCYLLHLQGGIEGHKPTLLPHTDVCALEIFYELCHVVVSHRFGALNVSPTQRLWGERATL